MKNIRKMFAMVLFLGILGIRNGHLALLQTDGAETETVLPYRVSMYPDRDQNALKKGIPYHSLPELSRLLEDFLS